MLNNLILNSFSYPLVFAKRMVVLFPAINNWKPSGARGFHYNTYKKKRTRKLKYEMKEMKKVYENKNK